MVLGNWVQYTRFVTVHCRTHPEHRCRVMHYSIEYDAVVEKQSIDACPTDQRDQFSGEFGMEPVPVTRSSGWEALVLFLDTPEGKPTLEETFIWVVTKTDMRWVRSELGSAALAREVRALRCGLDGSAWRDGLCTELASKGYTEADYGAGKPLPFDHSCAYNLYQTLFGQVADLIRGKHLLIVPAGPLTQLPFQVLVTAPPPANGDHKSATWLIRDHPLTVLPAVSSLKALRSVAHPSAATKPLIGFGNPLLIGNPKVAGDAARARLAREKRSCSGIAAQQPNPFSRTYRGVTSLVMRGGRADVKHILRQEPLPETADELCAVARDLGADPDEIRLGTRATEAEVKKLSASGELAQYRIAHFATHGALAGEINDTSEPGLLFTPPVRANAEDDGYLSASDIAGLKLDADWVILSACNTAAGNAKGAEALSGLARAFIYAHARALLVSHWAVDSNAAVKIITGTMRRFAAGGSRAEAIRQSMLALIDEGESFEAHPSHWAPFIVAGERARVSATRKSP